MSSPQMGIEMVIYSSIVWLGKKTWARLHPDLGEALHEKWVLIR